MPVDTGPDNIDFQIPEVDLGDTFNTWRDISNLSVYKLNKFKMYEGVSSGSISVSVSAGGTALFQLQDNVTEGVSFIAPVVFEDGVTFNGPVTFNAPTFTVNANLVTIDDYNLVLGDTAAASDAAISQAGGGGVFINRGSGQTASWIWTPDYIHGLTGVWRPDGHIGFTGGVAGIYPHEGTTLDIHGTAILLDGGSTAHHGLLVSMSTTGGGNTADRVIGFSRYSPAGATAFMEVLNGATYATAGLSASEQPFVRIPNGVNKKIVKQTGHSFLVGIPVSMNSDGEYFAAKADSVTNAEVVGVVSAVDGDRFEITFLGEVFGIGNGVNADGTSLVRGSVYYLSPYTAGKVTATQPTQGGIVHKAVFLATSPTSAIVYPWTGGVLTSPLVLSSSAQTSVRIQQLHQFKLGDILRFRPGSTSLTYTRTGSDPGTSTATYPNGIFVRAQANTPAESEVAGIVVSREEIGDSGVYRAFNLLMDGFYEFPAGLSAVNGGGAGNMQSGKVYFLNSGSAGTTGSLEKAGTPCYNDAAPALAGYVRKPMLFSTSTTTGYLYSYRGDVTGLPGISANTPLEYLLIQDLGSCGAQEDLKFGVRNATGSQGGTRVMTFDGTTLGNVRIGPAAFVSTSVGAGATLSVEGAILAGDRSATQGSIIIGSRYFGPYPETLNVFGTQFSSGNSVIGYGLRGKTGAAGYELTTSQSTYRSVLELGNVSNRPGFFFAGHSLGATNGTIGSNAPMTEYFKVVGGGGNPNIGTTATISGSQIPALVLKSDRANSTGKILFEESAAKAWEIAPVRANDEFVITDAFSGTTAMVIAPHVATGSSGCYVGIGTDAPVTKLHVMGQMSSTGTANSGLLVLSGVSLGGVQLQLGVTTGASAGVWIEGWNPGVGGATLTLQPTASPVIVGGNMSLPNGRLGIGVTGSISYPLTVRSTSSSGGIIARFEHILSSDPSAGTLTEVALPVWNGTSGLRIRQHLGSADSYNSVISTGQGTASLIFARSVSNVVTEAMRINGSDGRVGIGTTAPGASLDVYGVVRAHGGILFGTDTAAANTLDDYETGTWTPTWGGSMTVTGGTITARYTKIGKFVHLTLILDAVTIANAQASGHGGIPFAPVGGRSTSYITHNSAFAVNNPSFYVSGAGANGWQFLNNVASGAWVGCIPLNGASKTMVINHTYMTA